jgi:hypothetical protein
MEDHGPAASDNEYDFAQVVGVIFPAGNFSMNVT